jgi:hypothetical protein
MISPGGALSTVRKAKGQLAFYFPRKGRISGTNAQPHLSNRQDQDVYGSWLKKLHGNYIVERREK